MSENQGDADKRELTVRQLLGTLAASQERRTSRERHGDGELVRVDGIPHEASGCLLPDGTVTSARCLTGQAGLADDDRVWSRPVTPGEPFRRRGRLRIEPDAPRPEATVDGQVLAELRRLGWDLLQADDAGPG